VGGASWDRMTVGDGSFDQKTNSQSMRRSTASLQPAHPATHIGVQLPNKAGEVVMLEVKGQQVTCKLGRLPYNKAAVGERAGNRETWLPHGGRCASGPVAGRRRML
jgi:guanyl-specific ribonuclease Sa